MSREKWEGRFLALAGQVASWSKDPSSKVGCVIIRPDRTIASLGYNGFPRRVADNPSLLEDRPSRLMRIVHAEANAIVSSREPLHGYTMYVWPFPPCASCAGLIIQAGLTRVVAMEPDAAISARWADSLKAASTLFDEASVKLELLKRYYDADPST